MPIVLKDKQVTTVSQLKITKIIIDVENRCITVHYNLLDDNDSVVTSGSYHIEDNAEAGTTDFTDIAQRNPSSRETMYKNIHDMLYEVLIKEFDGTIK